MIVRIMNSAPSAWFSLQYNEDKVQRGVADICAVGNISSTDYKSIWEAVVGREKKIRKTEKPSLHIVFSPGEDDEMPTEKMVDFVGAWMKDVGLGDQPYAVYRHRDIARVHYHIVSTKLREDGKSVKANNLSYKSRSALMKLEKRYSFDYGKGREGQRAMSRRDRDKILKEKGFDPFRFSPSKSHVWDQIGLIYESVKRDFTFRSDDEFRTIMDACGLVAKIVSSKMEGNYLVVHYKDTAGHITGKPRIYNNLEYGMLHSLIKEKSKPATKRVKAEIREALMKAGSIKEFREILNKKEITPRRFVNKMGQHQGVSFVDFHDFQVVKASELGELSQIIRAAYVVGLEEARRMLLDSEAREAEVARKKEQEQENASFLRPEQIALIKGQRRADVPEYLSREMFGRNCSLYKHRWAFPNGVTLFYAMIDGRDYTIKYEASPTSERHCSFAEGFVSAQCASRVEFLDHLADEYISRHEAQKMSGDPMSDRVIYSVLRRAFPQRSINLHSSRTLAQNDLITIAYAFINGQPKTVILKSHMPLAIADGFVKQDVALNTGKAIPTRPDAGTPKRFGLFQLLNALSSVGGGHHQQASPSVANKKGDDLWDESIEAAEKEEHVRKKKRGISL